MVGALNCWLLLLLLLLAVVASPTMSYIPPFGLALLRVGIALPCLFLLAQQVTAAAAATGGP